MTSAVPFSALRPGDLLHRLHLRDASAADSRITHVERLAARAGRPVPWPGWVPEELRTAWVNRGISAPWAHQVEAAELARAGRHVVVATGTASGKSLAYQPPGLSRLLVDPRATVRYLSPTKALAADQLRSLAGLGIEGIRPATFDGDTPHQEREWIRQFSRFGLTNPDMLHRTLLPGHFRQANCVRSPSGSRSLRKHSPARESTPGTSPARCTPPTGAAPAWNTGPARAAADACRVNPGNGVTATSTPTTMSQPSRWQDVIRPLFAAAN